MRMEIVCFMVALIQNVVFSLHLGQSIMHLLLSRVYDLKGSLK